MGYIMIRWMRNKFSGLSESLKEVYSLDDQPKPTAWITRELWKPKTVRTDILLREYGPELYRHHPSTRRRIIMAMLDADYQVIKIMRDSLQDTHM